MCILAAIITSPLITFDMAIDAFVYLVPVVPMISADLVDTIYAV
jgi:ABC-type proline/glycine betaine transport system permease subunit